MLETSLFFAAFLAGIVNSIAGGGMLLVFPALLASGLPPIVANATTNLAAWPGSLMSAWNYRKYLLKLPAKYMLLLIPCVFGALAGAVLLSNTGSDDFERYIPWLVLAAVLLFTFQPLLHWHVAINLRLHKNAPLVILGLALIPMAVYGGYFGAGFGFLMLAFLGFTRLHDLHQINGLKNLASASITIICTAYLGSSGLIAWNVAPALILGSILGGYVGSHIAQKLNPSHVHLGIVLIGFLFVSVLFITD